MSGHDFGARSCPLCRTLFESVERYAMHTKRECREQMDAQVRRAVAEVDRLLEIRSALTEGLREELRAGLITRPALRYYGGKWRLAPWVIAHLPEHVSYVEPYAGAASVLLQKRPSAIEVYNDLDGQVVNFFRVLRERPEELISALELTPYARAELVACREPAEEPVEAARRFFVRSWLGRGAQQRTTRGWRFERELHHRRRMTVLFGSVLTDLTSIARRFRDVQIESSPALDVIETFDTSDTVFYCDPPYLASTRSRRWVGDGYAHDMTESDHRDLAAALAGIKGMALVSGYDSPLYAEIFAGWSQVKTTARVDFSESGTSPSKVECLWISPRAAERMPQRLLEGVG